MVSRWATIAKPPRGWTCSLKGFAPIAQGDGYTRIFTENDAILLKRSAKIRFIRVICGEFQRLMRRC